MISIEGLEIDDTTRAGRRISLVCNVIVPEKKDSFDHQFGREVVHYPDFDGAIIEDLVGVCHDEAGEKQITELDMDMDLEELIIDWSIDRISRNMYVRTE